MWNKPPSLIIVETNFFSGSFPGCSQTSKKLFYWFKNKITSELNIFLYNSLTMDIYVYLNSNSVALICLYNAPQWKNLGCFALHMSVILYVHR